MACSVDGLINGAKEERSDYFYNYQLEETIRVPRGRSKSKTLFYLPCLHQSCKDSHLVLKEKKWRVLFNYRTNNTLKKRHSFPCLSI